MTLLGHIVVAGVAMALIALSGALPLLLPAQVVDRLIAPLVAFAAGTLLGGALLHLQPAALAAGLSAGEVGAFTLAGFMGFLILEQFIARHHHHRPHGEPAPATYLVLFGDGVHNFLGGLAIGAAFVVDIRLGWTAWLAAALHEVPQEIGDFSVLMHGGWPRRRAMLLNVLSGLTFLVGALIAAMVPTGWDTAWLIPFAAGNFLYIGAVDLLPEVARSTRDGSRVTLVLAVALGVMLMAGTAMLE